MTIKPFKTHIETMDGQKVPTDLPAQTQAPVFADPVYETPEDVPVSLQHALKASYESGLSVELIHIVYDNIPKEWIERFVSQNPADPEKP
jgi:hypothetical protein